MNLLIVRHAPAGDKRRWAAQGKDDALRPLTPRGRRRMREAAQGLARLGPRPDLLATSPLARARQTADILEEAWDLQPVEVPDISPQASPEQVLAWLRGRKERTIAIVGHEPALGVLMGLLLTGQERSFMMLKKGQACLIEFQDKTQAGGGRLAWSLAPRQLRRLI